MAAVNQRLLKVRSDLDGAQRLRAIPTLGGASHHREEAAQTLVLDMDLDVVAQGGGGVVESVSTPPN